MAGINFVERCPDCQARRLARANRLASRISIIATILMALWVLWRSPADALARWYSGVGVFATYFLVRLITRRIAMEVLP